MVRKMTFLMIIILIFISCSEKKGSGDSASGIEKNQIELNVQNNRSENNVPAVNPPPASPPPRQQVQPEKSDFFFSGRTELLSLKSQGYIGAEGFSVGELYVEQTASAVEREVVEICRMFFQSLAAEGENPSIDPSSQREILEYYRYFFDGKIDMDEFLFGKPEIRGGDATVEIIIFPDAIPVYLYLINKDRRWLITAMEADLRREDRESSVEKWAPSQSYRPGSY